MLYYIVLVLTFASLRTLICFYHTIHRIKCLCLNSGFSPYSALYHSLMPLVLFLLFSVLCFTFTILSCLCFNFCLSPYLALLVSCDVPFVFAFASLHTLFYLYHASIMLPLFWIFASLRSLFYLQYITLQCLLFFFSGHESTHHPHFFATSSIVVIFWPALFLCCSKMCGNIFHSM